MPETRVLTANIRPGSPPLDLQAYERAGGYRGARKAVTQMAPGEVTEAVKDARLRGRGGAGFVTGMKWSFVDISPEARRPRYLVVNGDEMEPGTFKDRLLLEGDPHMMLDGIICACWALQAEVAYIFLRDEYRLAAALLQRAIAEAREAGYIGKSIFGSGFDLEVILHSSAGRYICGEETALLNALEGKRATPRAKPPFPPVVGLFGKPTVVNNVETLYNVPHIVLHGAEWFRSLSRSDDGGTKIYGVSGKVARPGAWELPLGVTLRELLEEHAGGMKPGLAFRGCLPGGASTDFLTADHLDVALDFSAVEKVGSRLGTGTAIVLDDGTCPVGMVRNLEQFFSHESCGWCTPCREGLPWTVRLLTAIEEGAGSARDVALLEHHVRGLGMGLTFCALAPGAMSPLGSALRVFASDFERHLTERRCPWRS